METLVAVGAGGGVGDGRGGATVGVGVARGAPDECGAWVAVAVAFGFGDGVGAGAAVYTGSAVHVGEISTPVTAPPPGWVRMVITRTTSSGTLMASKAILLTDTAFCVASGGLALFVAGVDIDATDPHERNLQGSRYSVSPSMTEPDNRCQ